MTMSYWTRGLWALLLLWAAGCANTGSDEPIMDVVDAEEAAHAPRVETLVLAADTFEDRIDITGRVESSDDAMLSAEGAGTVKMLARLGQKVAVGSVVARLDQGMVQAVLDQAIAGMDQAQATLELAEDSYGRMEPLYKDSIISAAEWQGVRTQLQQAQAGVRVAEALRQQAQEQFDNAVVTAPFRGTIEEHRVVIGERVALGTPVARIVDTRQVRISVGVPERYAGEIAVGTLVEISIPALRDFERTGRVTFAGNSINPRNRTFNVEAELDNADGRMKPDMIVNVAVPRLRLEDVLVIPRAAVLRDETGTSVFTVSRLEDGPVAMRKDVQLGERYAERIVVEDGLTIGDEVIVLGQNIVAEGTAVEIAMKYTRLDAEGIPVAN